MTSAVPPRGRLMALFTVSAACLASWTAAAPDASQVADRILAWGGDPAASVPYLRFTCVLEKDGKEVFTRTHYLDFRKSMHRVEMTDDEGHPAVCLTHLPSGIGACEVAARGMIEAEAAPYLEKAHAAWMHDTHWLLMPSRVKEPDVVLSQEGPVRRECKQYELLDLTFPAGRTPHQRCRLFVDAESGEVDRSECVLAEGAAASDQGEPAGWSWTGWTRFGEVMLATERIADGGAWKIHFRDIEIFKTLNERVFSSTADVDSWR